MSPYSCWLSMPSLHCYGVGGCSKSASGTHEVRRPRAPPRQLRLGAPEITNFDLQQSPSSQGCGTHHCPWIHPTLYQAHSPATKCCSLWGCSARPPGAEAQTAQKAETCSTCNSQTSSCRDLPASRVAASKEARTMDTPGPQCCLHGRLGRSAPGTQTPP